MSDAHLPPRERENVASISELLEDDHRRLDALAAEAQRLAEQGSLDGARASFEAFTSGLEWHIEAEEGVLFPEFTRLGGPLGPTIVMRREHELIRGAMSEARRALGADDLAAFQEALSGLGETLHEHNAKEEAVLYPSLDRLAGAGLAALVRRVQAG
jgi:iron-sulfur cluster repair protein YtfE (RIC family)